MIGLGLMGSRYAQQLQAGEIRGCRLAAVCHRDPARTAPFAPARAFSSSEELIRSGEVDAVVVATPHYSHTSIGIDALGHGLHLLVEKPLSVTKSDALRLLSAHRGADQVFGIMFNVRTRPCWQKVRELVLEGALGTVRRIHWTATAYFRTQAYYDLAPWRGTWAGEGGGILINQCPHQLDLLQWIFGMPARVRGFCRFGKYHGIEVEDEATAFLEYDSGMTAVFVASTGEFPGVHRTEIVGEMGRLVVEGSSISFQRNAVATTQFSRTNPHESSPPVEQSTIVVEGDGGNYRAMLQNFVDAILDGVPLIAPAPEGLHSLELANAILHSSLHGETVELPLDAAAYDRTLQSLISGQPAAR